jgi:uncharacterized protein YjiS (DUF1127 family)
MNAHTFNSQFFELPSLSYIDTAWEEQTHRTPVETGGTTRKTGLGGWFAHRIEALKARRRDVRAASELAMMSDHQLMDVGLSRSDLTRVFQPEFNEDLRRRGEIACCAKY